MAVVSETTTYESVTVKYTHYGTWRYYVSFAVSFGYRAIPTNDKNCKVVRVWLDNALIYDAYANIGNASFVFYPGTEDQPFYRGQMVMFFNHMVLKEGAGVPSVTAEIVDSTDLGAQVGTVYVGVSLTPTWADYSPETGRLVQLFVSDSDNIVQYRSIYPQTNSEMGLLTLNNITIDYDKPVVFMPWFSYVLAQNGDRKVLLNVQQQNLFNTSFYGDVDQAGESTYTGAPAFVMGIAQNCGRVFDQASSFFVVASDQADDDTWPYQVLMASNGTLAYAAGLDSKWTDEPVCMARGLKLGDDTQYSQLTQGTPPAGATGDVLVAFAHAVRRVRVGLAGSHPIIHPDADPAPLTPQLGATVDDVQIYSHDPSVGSIVRLYQYSLAGALNDGTTPIILLIETDAVNHRGIARKIDYDGTIIWSSGTIDLDGITDKQLRTLQCSADLSTNKLGIISYHTAHTYTIVDLDTGVATTGTWQASDITIDPTTANFWVGSKETFYPFNIDNLYMRVDVPGVTAIPLDEALRDIAIRAGYTEDEIVITNLHDVTIQGYIIGSNTTLGNILDGMSTLYQFTWSEIGGILFITAIFDSDVFQSVVTIPEADLAVLQEGQNGNQQIVSTVLADDASMPNSIVLNYIDPDINYQQGTQIARRLNTPRTTQSDKQASISIPIIDTGADMLMRLYRSLYSAWAAQKTHSLRLPPKYLALIPTDGFTFSALGFEHRVTAVMVTVNADFSVSLSAAERTASARSPQVESQTPIQPLPRGPVAPVRAALLDLPDTTPVPPPPGLLNLGVSLGGYAAGLWASARLDTANAADPGSWGTRFSTVTEARSGVVMLVSGTFTVGSIRGPFETDYDTQLFVALGSLTLDDLPTATYDEMLAGKNLIAVGKDARFELIQFGDVTDNGDGTVILSRLFRGRFGTDTFIGQLQPGDGVFLYDPLMFITYPIEDFKTKAVYAYRGVVPQQDPEDAAVNIMIPNGNSARPYAPVNFTAFRNGSGDVVLTWRRRNRFTGQMVDGSGDIPDEIGRKFSIDLWKPVTSNGISLRTISFTCDGDDDTFTITAAQMTTAGYSDDAPVINFGVWQVDDATVGRGFGSVQSININVADVSSLAGSIRSGFFSGSLTTRLLLKGSILADPTHWRGELLTTPPLAGTLDGTSAWEGHLSVGIPEAFLDGTLDGTSAWSGDLSVGVPSDALEGTLDGRSDWSGDLTVGVPASRLSGTLDGTSTWSGDLTVTTATDLMSVTSLVAEVLRRPVMGMRVSDIVAEVLHAPSGIDNRITSLGAEVLWHPTGGSNLAGQGSQTEVKATGTFSITRPMDVGDGDIVIMALAASAGNSGFAMSGWTQISSNSVTGLGGRLYQKTVVSGDTAFGGTFGTGVKGVAVLLRAGAAGSIFPPASYTNTNNVAASSTTQTSPQNNAVFKPMSTYFAVMMVPGALTFTDPTTGGFGIAQYPTDGTGSDATIAVVTGASYGGTAPAVQFNTNTAAVSIGFGISGIPAANFGS